MTEAIDISPLFQERPAKKKRRIFLWIFLAVQALFVLWMAVTVVTGVMMPDTYNCAGLDEGYRACSTHAVEDAAFGVGGLLIILMIVDFLMGVPYALYRLSKRI